MGYELTFHYHEEISKGEYDRETTKTKNVKIGSPTDDIPMEAVASRIMAQLARRNILVVDVDIFEYTKKKLSYKETEDGILIKNKKYSFDDGVNLSCITVDEEEAPVNNAVGQLMNNQQGLQQLLAALLAGNQNIISDMAKAPAKDSKPNLAVAAPVKALRHEIFDPFEKSLIEDSRRRGMMFTVGKKYPIINERADQRGIQFGMIYTTIDDTGKRYNLNDKFFTPQVGLQFGDQIEEEAFIPTSAVNKVASDGLDWGNVVDDNVVKIR